MTPSLPWFSDLRYVVHANVSDYFLHFSPSLQCSQHSGPLYLLGHIYLFFKSFLLLLNYSCPLFSQFLSSALVTPLPTFKLCCPCPQVLYTCSLIRPFPFFSVIPLPLPLWSWLVFTSNITIPWWLGGDLYCPPWDCPLRCFSISNTPLLWWQGLFSLLL